MDTHTRDRPTGRRRPSQLRPAQHRVFSHGDVCGRGSKPVKPQYPELDGTATMKRTTETDVMTFYRVQGVQAVRPSQAPLR